MGTEDWCASPGISSWDVLPNWKTKNIYFTIGMLQIFMPTFRTPESRKAKNTQMLHFKCFIWFWIQKCIVCEISFEVTLALLQKGSAQNTYKPIVCFILLIFKFARTFPFAGLKGLPLGLSLFGATYRTERFAWFVKLASFGQWVWLKTWFLWPC